MPRQGLEFAPTKRDEMLISFMHFSRVMRIDLQKVTLYGPPLRPCLTCQDNWPIKPLVLAGKFSSWRCQRQNPAMECMAPARSVLPGLEFSKPFYLAPANEIG